MTARISKKDQILQSAFELFSSSSYYAVSIDDVLKKADASKGALFHHFSNKYELASESLWKALDEEWFGRLFDLQSLTDPVQRIREFIGFSIDTTVDSPGLIRFAIELMEEGKKRGESGQQWREFLNRFVQVVGGMLEECDAPNPYVKAELLISSIDAVGLQTAFFSATDAIDPELLKAELFEIFVGNYIQNKKGMGRR